MLALPDDRVPRLDSIISVPAFTRDGRLLVTEGYHEEHRVYLDLNGLSPLKTVQAQPSDREVDQARTLILNELLGDFPFVGSADRAHAVAALVHPFVRLLIEGPTPAHLIEAPTAGCGKGLLAEVIALITTGSRLPTCSLPNDEDEIRRTLTTELSKGRPVIFLDNLSLRYPENA